MVHGATSGIVCYYKHFAWKQNILSPERVENSTLPWPIALWLQGGPGASGVGIGNFEEVGHLDTSLKPRNSTWLQKADLLFVDNPVGTGFSYVEDNNLVVKTDEEAATDLTTLLKELFNKNESQQRSPLFIVAESYGGKYAATLGLAVSKAIKAGELKLTFGGVALGDSWISPVDYVCLRYPPFHAMSNREKQKLILAGDFSFDEHTWKSVSSSTKQLISSRLTVDPQRRPSAQEDLYMRGFSFHQFNANYGQEVFLLQIG